MKESKQTFSNGFTLVKTVLIIAVVSILAAILIPTYASLIKKASITANMQIASLMNETISKHENEIENFQDVVFYLNKSGFSIEKLNPTSSGNRFVWEEKSNQILLLNEKLEVVPETITKPYNCENWKVWLTVKNPSELISTNKINFNFFLTNNYNGNFELKTLSTFETGEHVINGNVVYSTNSIGEATFSGIVNGTISINTPNATINQFGIAKKIFVNTIGDNTLNLNGCIETLEIKNGKVELKPASYVKELNFITNQNDCSALINGGLISELVNQNLPETVSFTNDFGFVEKIPEELKSLIQNSENYKIQIKNIIQLETFRNSVNYGANYGGITVQLTSDITLPNGWIPIGEFSRSSAEKNVGESIVYNDKIIGFAGVFDGNNKKISNLNNKNYKPNAINSLMKGTSTINGKAEYAYGFFGVVTNATIKNLNIINVEIDIPLSNTYGDSVGALVGYAVKDLTIINCEVSGNIKAYDAVGGLVGRSCFANEIIFNNCNNKIKINASQRAGGLLGIAEKFLGENITVSFNLCMNMELITSGTGNVETKDNIAIASGILSCTSSSEVIYTFTSCENYGNIITNYSYNSENAYADSFIVKIIETAITEENSIKNGVVKINGIIQNENEED